MARFNLCCCYPGSYQDGSLLFSESVDHRSVANLCFEDINAFDKCAYIHRSRNSAAIGCLVAFFHYAVVHIHDE